MLGKLGCKGWCGWWREGAGRSRVGVGVGVRAGVGAGAEVRRSEVLGNNDGVRVE